MKKIKLFRGFQTGKIKEIRLPEQFFQELLPLIDSLGELKLVLYVLWRLQRMEGTFRYLSRDDFLADKSFLSGLADDSAEAVTILQQALEQAVRRGVLLSVQLADDDRKSVYFLNSAKGRAAVEAIRKGEWSPLADHGETFTLEIDRPNIFQLYEENIGPLTPMIAEMLRDAEQTYPTNWIEDAIRIAVSNNARNWRYVETILRKWLERGRDDKKDRRDAEKDRRRYIEGEFADFIEH